MSFVKEFSNDNISDHEIEGMLNSNIRGMRYIISNNAHRSLIEAIDRYFLQHAVNIYSHVCVLLMNASENSKRDDLSKINDDRNNINLFLDDILLKVAKQSNDKENH